MFFPLSLLETAGDLVIARFASFINIEASV